MFRLNDTRPRHPEAQAWLESREGEVGEIVRGIYVNVRRIAPEANEVMHDGWLALCLGDAAFAQIGAFKAHASLSFFYGAELADPSGLLEGEGIRMRHVKFRPGQAPDRDAVERLIIAAWRDVRDRAVS